MLEAAGLGALVDERLVDVAALHWVERPEDFDLIVTRNLFGDHRSRRIGRAVTRG